MSGFVPSPRASSAVQGGRRSGFHGVKWDGSVRQALSLSLIFEKEKVDGNSHCGEKKGAVVHFHFSSLLVEKKWKVDLTDGFCLALHLVHAGTKHNLGKRSSGESGGLAFKIVAHPG